MKSLVLVEELIENQWQRYRDIRLAALESDGHAFGSSLEAEILYSEAEWRSKARQYKGLVASIAGEDIGMMSIENLTGDFGATCWIGSCWVDSEYRQHGVLRALFEFTDAHADESNWQRQGLGVWIDNEIAIKAYEKIGFVTMGEPEESTRKPGLFYQRMIRDAVI
jgi:RimJ/RimL family protein N-acetyltransferase